MHGDWGFISKSGVTNFDFDQQNGWKWLTYLIKLNDQMHFFLLRDEYEPHNRNKRLKKCLS